ncbi:hypothetical protein [Dyella sp.]|uniref:hypothetical protein n=1 Tax=Dyella sp. TaxID=1869338 RepID=UPI002ED1B027
MSRARMIALLVIKDWQVYQKQLAGYVAGMVLALGLIGTGKPWASSAGALLLLVLQVVVGSFAIQSSLLTERKQQTLAFIMSLPVSPMDVYWGKLLANLAIYMLPFSLVTGGMVAMIMLTAIPDGSLVWMLLTAMFLFASFSASLCFAIVVESEGWNTFMMLALMTLLGPFMYLVAQLDGIAPFIRGDRVVWSPAALGVLAAECAAIAIAIGLTSWLQKRKTSFL